MELEVNGITVHYEVQGRGPWVTLSHSLAADLSMWNAQAAVLQENYTVLRYDIRGHGGSSAPEGAYDWDLLTDDVLGLLDALKVERTHFVGLSLGGMIGQHLALRAQPRLLSLTLADTASRYPAEAMGTWKERIRLVQEKGMAPLVQPTLERWFTEAYRRANPDVIAHIGGLVLATKPAGYIGCAHVIPTLDITDKLRALNLPTLVIVGEQDEGTPLAMAQDIAQAILAARLEVIPGAAHLSNIEQAHLFNRLLTEFLARAGSV